MQLLKSDVKCKAFCNIYSTQVLHNLAGIYLEIDAILVKRSLSIFLCCGNSNFGTVNKVVKLSFW